MTTAAPSPLRTVGWNGLCIDVPSSWQTIVKGKECLLFEEDFTPMLQLRWQRGVTGESVTSFDKLADQLARQWADTLTQHPWPANWPELPATRQAMVFRQEETKSLLGAIIRCTRCATVLFAQFFEHDSQQEQQLAGVLATLHCHTSDAHTTLWRILDFSFRLPTPLTLTKYGFAAGLTTLSFAATKKQSVHIARISPAEQRLKGTSLEELLTGMIDRHDTSESFEEREGGLEYRTQPSIPSQILTRLNRKKPFQHIRMWHEQTTNSIVAVQCESIHPIDETTLGDICETYEPVY